MSGKSGSAFLLYGQGGAMMAAAAAVAAGLRKMGHKVQLRDATLLTAAERERADVVFAHVAVHDRVAAVYPEAVAVDEFADPSSIAAAVGAGGPAGDAGQAAEPADDAPPESTGEEAPKRRGRARAA